MIYKNVIIVDNQQQTNNIIANYKIPSLGDVIFDVVTLIPSVLNVGTVSGVFNTEIELRNTTLSNITIDNIIIENGIGISIELIEGSLNLRAGDFARFNVSIVPEGPSTIDANINFEITGAPDAVLPVNGDRVAFFNFDINYAQQINEYYTHYNVITTSFNGTEQRSNISENPRWAFEYYYTLIGSDRIKAEALLYNNAMDVIQVPVHQLKNPLLQDLNVGDLSLFVNVVNSNIQVGMKVMIKDGNDYDIIEVDGINGNEVLFSNAIANNYKAGATVYPLVNCNINQNIAADYETNDICNFLIRFEVLDNEYININTTDDSSFEEFEGIKIIARTPSRDITFTKTQQRLFDLIDNTYGVRTKTVNDKSPSTVMTYTFSLLSQDEITQSKALFNNMKGRYNEFYVPSSTNDFVAKEDILAGVSSILIENDNQFIYNNNLNKAVLRLQTKNNDIIIKKIVDISSVDNSTLSIDLDSPFLENINLNEIANIQFLELARFNNDTLQISHTIYNYAEVSIDVNIFRGIY